MNNASEMRWEPEPGSFRDPAGYVFYRGGRVLRAVAPEAADEFRCILASNRIQDLMSGGRLVRTRILDRDEISDIVRERSTGDGFSDVVSYGAVAEHARVPFISYPYEWPFEALRAAALAHLSLHLDLLKDGFTLSDASAFNMQFNGVEPLHIDMLSVVRYEEGARWTGYGQFLRQFLNPLVLESATGLSFAPHYRATLDGVSADELVRILPWRFRLRPWSLVHVVAPAMLDRRARRIEENADASRLSALPKSRLVSLLEHLQRIVAGLKRPRNRTAPWLDYTVTNTYSQAEQEAKLSAVGSLCARFRPALVLDVGCNTGQYARAALDAGAGRVIGVDSDRAALDAAFLKARASKSRLLPLAVDIVNPSPSQGWAHSERKSFTERLEADALLALAILHHIVISHNVPLASAVRVLTSLAPRGMIEFVPKDDPQVLRLLRFRKDIFPDYNIETFRTLLAAHAQILSEIPLSEGGRTLFVYEGAERRQGEMCV